MSFIKITEQPSLHEDLEQLSVRSLLEGINEEDQKVALAVRSCIPHIERLVYFPSHIHSAHRQVLLVHQLFLLRRHRKMQ